MNNEHVKGTLNQAKGRVKEEVGHLTGNDSMAGEGVSIGLRVKSSRVWAT